jgi:hypothetical protein
VPYTFRHIHTYLEYVGNYINTLTILWGFYIQIEEKDHFLNLKAFECDGSPRKDQGATKKYDYTPGNDQHVFSQVNRHVAFLSNVVFIPF